MIIPIRHLALIGLLIAVPVSAWAIAYRPMNVAVRGVAEEIRSRTTAMTHFDEINSQYRELKEMTRNLSLSTEYAMNRIPSQSGADQWLQSASDEAHTLGLIVKSVTTSGERAEGPYNILPVDLIVTGTFESVYKLIQHLERMDRMTRIDRMSIQRIEGNRVDARLVIHLIFTSGGE
jgi:Tfp pilus assembly protein PilO